MSGDSRNIDDLHPHLAALCRAHIALCKTAGIGIVVTFTLRSMETQGELYAQGRTKPGKIVTNAKPGQSYHNYGLAYDVVPVDAHGHAAWSQIGEAKQRWYKIGELGKSLGMRWGGDFHSIKDLPHFEWSGELTLHDLQGGKRP